MKVTLNLASRRYVNRRILNRVGMTIALLLLVLLLFQGQNSLQKTVQIKSYEKKLAEMNNEYQKLLGIVPKSLSPEQIERQQLEFHQAEVLLERDSFRWTFLFDRLEKRLPSRVSITSFTPDYKTKSLELSGVAKGLVDLQLLLKNLHKDSFEQIFLQSQSQVTVRDAQGEEITVLSFNITLEGVF